MLLKPLTQFVCDSCGQLIEKPEDGYVEWKSEPDPSSGISKVGAFRIVHHYNSSPLKTPTGCYSHSRMAGNNSVDLHDFLKFLPQNLAFFLDTGYVANPQRKSSPQVNDFTEFADFMRRFTIPYYEQARLFFHRAEEELLLEGLNEISLYKEETLKGIIEYFLKE